MKLTIEEIFRRFRDISNGYPVGECAERWGTSRQGASIFIKSAGARHLHRQTAEYAHY